MGPLNLRTTLVVAILLALAALPLRAPALSQADGKNGVSPVTIDAVYKIKEIRRVTRRRDFTRYKIGVDWSWNVAQTQLVTLSHSYPTRDEKRLMRRRVQGMGSKTKRRNLRIPNVFLDHPVTIRAYLGRELDPANKVDEFVLSLTQQAEGVTIARAHQSESSSDGTNTSYGVDVRWSWHFGRATPVRVTYEVPSVAGETLLAEQVAKGTEAREERLGITIPNSVGEHSVILRTYRQGGDGSWEQDHETTLPLRREMNLGEAWARSYGGPSYDAALSVDGGGGDGVVFAGNGSFGEGAMDFWVVKLNDDGTVTWQKRYHNGARLSFERAYSLQQTSDGGYIVAGNVSASNGSSLDDDAWVLKLRSDGTVAWSRTYGGSSSERLYSIRETDDGGYVAAGFTESFGAGKKDFWVVKLTGDGAITWQKAYGTAAKETAYSVDQTGNGDFVVAGYRQTSGSGGLRDPLALRVLKLDQGGDVTWSKEYGSSGNSWLRTWASIQATRSGEYIVAGTASSTHATYHGANILKLRESGTVIWQKEFMRFGLLDQGDVTASSIRETEDGGFIVAGSTQPGLVYSFDGPNALVFKLNRDGVVEWKKEYGGAGDEFAYSAVETADGYVAAGSTESFGAGAYDAWILRLDLDGTVPPLGSDPSMRSFDTAISPSPATVEVDGTSAAATAGSIIVEDTGATVEQQAP